MDTLFLQILNMSITASYVILFVIAAPHLFCICQQAGELSVVVRLPLVRTTRKDVL